MRFLSLAIFLGACGAPTAKVGKSTETTPEEPVEEFMNVFDFLDDYADLACDAYKECEAPNGPTKELCEGDPEKVLGACAYDPDYAEDCLAAEWECPANGAPDQPEVCQLAWDCDTPNTGGPTTTTETGTFPTYPTNPGTGVTSEEFVEQYLDLLCDGALTCGSDPGFIDAVCNPQTTSTDPGCTFVPELADACLSGGYTCESGYPTPAIECNYVYNCE